MGSVRMRMIELLVMLPQQILAIVIAVRGSHQCMNVIACMLVVVERDSGLMIELDQDNGAVDSIIKRAHIVDRADPGEIGLVEMRLHFLEPDFGMARTDAADVDFNQ